MSAGYKKSRAWTELDLSALDENVAALKKLLPPGCRLMPAVKCQAYGHGALPVARELNRLGVREFCVAEAQEGVELRRGGVRGLILVLGYTHPENFALLRRYRLTQTVVDCDYAEELNAFGKKLSVHVGIDTGMHRIGQRFEDMDRLCKIFSMKNLTVDGAFTHLCADETTGEADRRYTLSQGKAFYDTLSKLRERGYSCPKVHILASSGLMNYPELGGDYARVGIALYGTMSTTEETAACPVKLKPALSVKTRVASVRTLAHGERAGYGLKFEAARETKLGALSIGYGDGLPRALSCGVGSVLINGCRAPIVGNICMDQTLVDVTDLPDIHPGDEAVIIGTSGQKTITACDVAEESGTIANEILSRLGERLERVVIN